MEQFIYLKFQKMAFYCKRGHFIAKEGILLKNMFCFYIDSFLFYILKTIKVQYGPPIDTPPIT